MPCPLSPLYRAGKSFFFHYSYCVRIRLAKIIRPFSTKTIHTCFTRRTHSLTRVFDFKAIRCSMAWYNITYLMYKRHGS